MRKLFSVILVLLVCFCTVFSGCGTPGGPKSAEKHLAKTEWKYDNDTHWQECSECDLVVDINNYYAQKTYVERLSQEGKLPKRANTPDKYANEFGFETFAQYLEVYDQGKAPHLYVNGVCVCGKGA